MDYRVAVLALSVRLLIPAPGRAQNPAVLADSLISERIRNARAPFIELRDEAQPFGEGRYFNLAVRAAGPDGPGAQLLACVVRVEPRPSSPTCVRVPTPGIDPEVSPPLLSTVGVEVADFDDDGEPEARFEVSYSGPLPRGMGGGETNEYTRFYVFDATPAPHLAASVLLASTRHESGRTTMQSDVELTDVNGDGHLDIVVTGEICSTALPGEERGRCRPVRRQLLWSRRTDGWSPSHVGDGLHRRVRSQASAPAARPRFLSSP